MFSTFTCFLLSSSPAACADIMASERRLAAGDDRRVDEVVVGALEILGRGLALEERGEPEEEAAAVRRHDLAVPASLWLGPARPLQVEAGDGRGRARSTQTPNGSPMRVCAAAAAVVAFPGKRLAPPSRRKTNWSSITSMDALNIRLTRSRTQEPKSPPALLGKPPPSFNRRRMAAVRPTAAGSEAWRWPARLGARGGGLVHGGKGT
jgi:hypothetical protein